MTNGIHAPETSFSHLRFLKYSLVYHRGAKESPDSLFLSLTTPSSDHTLQTTPNICSLVRVNSQIILVFPLSPEPGELLAAQTGK